MHHIKSIDAHSLKCIRSRPLNALELEAHQIQHHFTPRNPRCPPQRPKVKRARKGICIAKSHHGRNPAASVLERKTGAVHLVLLDGAAHEVMHATLPVSLWLVGSRRICQLFTAQDVKVVVGRVSTSVSFSANCCPCCQSSAYAQRRRSGQSTYQI